ncbi:hypothetical protein [Comamonas testosteroni]|uniref:Uncharacterized protein n=1 Tax=Comamonas testosteroni TaxID=285 RepID=A0A096H069_COMTE|nr:hypothetical protein [Comamonas testosteroni]KGH30845.1 hypothetical protein P353_08265 [Comamonas testosteroni]WKL18758.1 hypothetical protein QYQ99_27540 [Comamonas testosteroni]
MSTEQIQAEVGQQAGAAIEAAQAEAMKIMAAAKRQIENLGLEVSLITRCPNGSKWPVLMLEAGQSYADIEAVRNGQR